MDKVWTWHCIFPLNKHGQSYFQEITKNTLNLTDTVVYILYTFHSKGKLDGLSMDKIFLGFGLRY